jgi:hypothetical protein
VLQLAQPEFFQKLCMQTYIDFLNKQCANHVNLKDAINALTLFNYIDENIDTFSAMYGSHDAIHDLDGLYINLKDHQSAAAAKNYINTILSEVKKNLEYLLAIEDEKIQKTVLNFFLWNIESSKTANLEEYFKNAIAAVNFYKNHKIISVYQTPSGTCYYFLDKEARDAYLIYACQELDGLYSLDSLIFNGTALYFTNAQLLTLEQRKNKQPREKVLDLSAENGGHYLIKSIRWDNFNFINNFIKGITKSCQNRHKESLRHGNRKRYTVHFGKASPTKGEGKHNPYSEQGEKLKALKYKRSQAQSTSYLSPKLRCPVFGFNKDRASLLVGFVFASKDSLLNRIFEYDGGTVERPYDQKTLEKAEAYHKEKAEKVLFKNLDDLETKTKNTSYNEVMARVRFKTKSKKVSPSGIALFSYMDNEPYESPNNFAVRAIAQYYEARLLKALKEQATADNKVWDETYRVPT